MTKPGHSRFFLILPDGHTDNQETKAGTAQVSIVERKWDIYISFQGQYMQVFGDTFLLSIFSAKMKRVIPIDLH